ncbi:MAG: SpoIID/LytB domain-containing protein [Clostridiales bacterium]|nr:SpoIID/LytB domain-containing protein [Clostridiales bacterium]
MLRKIVACFAIILGSVINSYAASCDKEVNIGLFFDTKMNQVDQNYNNFKVSVESEFEIKKYTKDCIEIIGCKNESIDVKKMTDQNKIVVYKENNKFLCAKDDEYIEIVPKNRLFTINSERTYRGNLILKNTSEKKFVLINKLFMEEYLYGVVVKEIGFRAPIEAIKAQAIAARTYTLTNMGMFSTYGFDLTDSKYQQVYGGYTSEKEEVNSAVDETKNLTMFYDDKPIKAFYFASSGGRTENCENVWVNKIPYLVSVPDEYERNRGPRNWSVYLTCDQISSRMKNRGVELGEILDVVVTKRVASGRVLELKIIGSKGTYTLNKNEVRVPFNLRSQLFWIQKEGNTFHFYGKGFGHGVGLSQIGAMAMADAGFNYEGILKHYFTGIEIKEY